MLVQILNSRAKVKIQNILDFDFSFWFSLLLKQVGSTDKNIKCSNYLVFPHLFPYILFHTNLYLHSIKNPYTQTD